MSNTKDIVEAFRNNMDRRKQIDELHDKIRELYIKMMNEDIPALMNLYKFLFKNISPTKVYACDIEDFNPSDYSYRDEDEDNDIKNRRKLFVNNEGFSMSSPFLLGEKREIDITRTEYIQQFNVKSFMRILRRIYKHRGEILNAIEPSRSKEYKKSIFIRFMDAYEKSGCEIFDFSKSFDFLKEIVEKKEIEYYDEDSDGTIKKMNINFFRYKEASHSIAVDYNDETYRSGISIDLKDLEKMSQIFDEVMAFLNKYHEHLQVRDKSLLDFKSLLEEKFARELILDSLKEKKKER